MDDYVYEEINIGGARRNVSYGLYMKERLYASPRIEVYKSDAFGRCLYLDGALQCSEADEAIYHEVLVHSTLLRVTPKNVLIIGGGDGGSLREVLKHKRRGLERVVFCEINPEVIEICKEHFPSTNLSETLKDPIVEVVNQCGAAYLKNIHCKQFDAIIVDCPDPTPESNILYTREFFQECVHPALAPNGVFVIQAGNVFIKERFVRNIKFHLERLWLNVQYHYAPIPSFPSGGIGFLLATNTKKFPDCDLSGIDTKYLTKTSWAASILMAPKSLHENRRWNNFDWFCHNVFDFRSVCSSGDSKVMNAFFALEDEPQDPDIPYSYMSFVCGKDYGKDHYVLSLLTTDERTVEKIRPLIEEWAIERKIQLHDFPINGVSWFGDGSIAIHYVGTKGKFDAFLYPNMMTRVPENTFDKIVLNQHVFGDKGFISVTFSDLSRDYILGETNTGWTCEMQRVRTNSQQLRDRLPTEGQKTVDLLSKQGMMFEQFLFDRPKHYAVGFGVR